MKAASSQRRSHAALSLPIRYLKGRKIERLLELPSSIAPLRLLEVGVGAGGISSYFANLASTKFDVDGVDVVDNRQIVHGYRFTLVDGTQLPFSDGSFDVVISNHVIEHVGSNEEQAHHLSELRRVLCSDGVGYLAMPNRWMLVEPHYQLVLLSWWPERWRTAWLRLWGKGDVYDCRPMSSSVLETRLADAGFRFEHLHAVALRATFEIESPRSLLWRWVLRHVPERLWGAIRWAFPTLIYRIYIDF